MSCNLPCLKLVTFNYEIPLRTYHNEIINFLFFEATFMNLFNWLIEVLSRDSIWIKSAKSKAYFNILQVFIWSPCPSSGQIWKKELLQNNWISSFRALATEKHMHNIFLPFIKKKKKILPYLEFKLELERAQKMGNHHATEDA